METLRSIIKTKTTKAEIMNKPKALFIGFKRDYLNDQLKVIISVLNQVFDLSFYGPGFTKEEILDKSIDDWISKKEFDIIFMDDFCYVFDDYDEKKIFNLLDEAFVCHFDKNTFYRRVTEFMNFYKNYTKQKVWICLRDFYNVKDEYTNYLKKSGGFYLSCFGYSLNYSVKEIKERHVNHPFFKISSINDNWFTFEIENKHKIISFPFAIANNYFDFGVNQNRRNRFSIVGVLYRERKSVIGLLNLKSKIDIFSDVLLYRLRSLFRKNKMTPFILNKKKFRYKSLISNSTFCFCSGGPVDYPVRKYFEIPANGSIPIGYKCNGFEHLGFKHGENFIEATTKEDVKKTINTLSSEEIVRISNNARSHIFNSHSEHARVKQMELTFKKIIDQTFHGSIWENGLYKFLNKN